MFRAMLLAALTAFSSPVGVAPPGVPAQARWASETTTEPPSRPSGAAAWGPGTNPAPSVAGPAPSVAGPAPSVAGSAPGWGWPLDPAPAVVRPFHAPPTPWSAGHRGVDLAAAVAQPVLAPREGQVSFVGMVAGRGVVVLTHADGQRTSYEPVTGVVPVGSLVRRGERFGVLDAAPGHCAPATCLHWGLRRGETYLDPLRPTSADPPVLKPWEDG